MELWTAFMIGLVGSLHCVGMCGPIALALPYQSGLRWRAAGNMLLYNVGRVVTYSLLGAVIGLLGRGLFLAGFQRQMSIGLGIVLLLIALFSINVESQMLRIPVLQRFQTQVKYQLGRLLSQTGPAALFSIGLLNGLLPCGLVYVAIVGAVTTGGVAHSMAYMVLFGLGTLPLMLATALAGQFIDLRWRRRLRHLVPVFLFGFALLFLFRGFNFDVPVELRFWQDMENVPMCH